MLSIVSKDFSYPKVISRFGHDLHVPFKEVLRPRRATKLPAVYRDHQIVASCHREMARSQALKAKLQAEFKKTVSVLEMIQINLARVRDIAPPGDSR
jgi:hypothetical protein